MIQRMERGMEQGMPGAAEASYTGHLPQCQIRLDSPDSSAIPYDGAASHCYLHVVM
jgi:hypothetical protein